MIISIPQISGQWSVGCLVCCLFLYLNKVTLDMNGRENRRNRNSNLFCCFIITLDSLIFDVSRLILGAALQPSVEMDWQA